MGSLERFNPLDFVVNRNIGQTIETICREFIGRPLTKQTLHQMHSSACSLSTRFQAEDMLDKLKESLIFTQKIWASILFFEAAQNILEAVVHIKDGRAYVPYLDAFVSWDVSYLDSLWLEELNFKPLVDLRSSITD